MNIEHLLGEALGGRRDEVLLALAKQDAEESLLDYFRLVWPVLEPGRQFVEGRAIRMMIEAMEAVEAGHIKKLLMNVPPGFSKSTLVDVMFPTWVWGPRRRPDRRFCAWSYGEEITIRDNIKKRDIIRSEIYQGLWGDVFQLSGDQNEKKLIKNDKTGFFQAAGIHGAGTGHRGDFDSIDDPHKVKEAESEIKRYDANLFVAETFPTRKNDEDCAFVIIMQRIHQDDVSGRVLAEKLGYDHMCIPMEHEADHPHLWSGFDFPGASEEMKEGEWRTEDSDLAWPERFSRAEVDDLKKSLRSVGGDYAVAGQLQQRPVSREGGLFDPTRVVYIDEILEENVVSRARGWDLAASTGTRAAYTVGVKLAILQDGRLIVEHVKRLRGDPAQVKDAILGAAVMDGVEVRQDLPQDPGQAGKVQKVDLVALLNGYNVRFSVETGSKEVRAMPFAAQWAGGNVCLLKADWNAEYLRELSMFPMGQFMDQVDATSRAHGALLTMSSPTVAASRPIVIGPHG